MKSFLLLGLLLTGLLEAALPAPALAIPTATASDSPNSLGKMRRHLRHQAKMRLRQNRRR